MYAVRYCLVAVYCTQQGIAQALYKIHIKALLGRCTIYTERHRSVAVHCTQQSIAQSLYNVHSKVLLSQLQPTNTSLFFYTRDSTELHCLYTDGTLYCIVLHYTVQYNVPELEEKKTV